MRVALISRSRRAGFTLIELMTVLIIIAIMSAMILPEMRGTYEDAILRSSSRDLVSLFNMVSSRAIAANQIHRVRFDLTTGHYWIERCIREGARENEFAPISTDSEAQGIVDPRLVLSILKPEDMPVDQTEETASSDDTATDSTNSDNAMTMAAAMPKTPRQPVPKVGEISSNSMDSTSEDEDAEETEEAEPEDPTECIVQFFPDGTAESKVLILEDHSGFRRAFQINPYTSRVQVLDAGRRL